MKSFLAAQEKRKFGLLAVIFSLIIGVYWLLRPVKDGVFLSIVGGNYQPQAKLLSILVVGFSVFIYSKLLDRFQRHKLLYGYAIFYALCTAIFAFLIWHPTIGISNLDASPYRILGWAWYLYVETFGSIMVSLFWSFVSDTTTPEMAKKGYFTVAIGGQSGGFVAPLLAKKMITLYGTGLTLLVPVVCLFLLVFLVLYYMRTVPAELMQGYRVKDTTVIAPKPGFFEGIKLLFQTPYLFGIFIMVSFYEIVVTIIDYHFKILARSQYVGEHLVDYLYKYALCVNGIALLCLVVGIGEVGRRLGLTRTLLVLPLTVAAAVIVLNMYTVLSVAFFIVIGIKGINYALIQPSKEQLYIPTTPESKYKAKAWIDIFGSRFSKGGGAAINAFKKAMSHDAFMWFTVLVSMGLIGIWVIAATYVGRMHAKAIKEEKLVC